MTDEQQPHRNVRKDRRREARKAQRVEARQRVKSQPDKTPVVSAGGKKALKLGLRTLRQEVTELATQQARAADHYKTTLDLIYQKLDSLERADQNLDHRRLRQKWVVPVTQPMALISQVPRSGGTLLGRLFDGHPECFSHPLELRWGHPSKENWPSFAADSGMSALEAFALLTEKWAQKFVADGGYSKYPKPVRRRQADEVVLYPFVYDRHLAFDIFAAAYRHDATTRRAVLNAYLTSVFNGWLDYQNLYAGPKRWVTCFLPTMVTVPDSVERFFADYPEGLLITLVRHPGSWFASFASFSQDKGEVDLAESLSLWLDSTRASLDAIASYGDRVMIVLFDDLVLRTEAVMRALCARMHIAFDPLLLHPTYNGMPILSDSSFSLSATIDADTTQRHHTELATEQRATIDRVAMPIYDDLVRRFGVERTIV